MTGRRFFLSALALLIAGAGASGYVLLGVRWATTPVVMHLELGSTNPLIDGSTSWDTVAATALGVWNYYLRDLQFSPVIDSKSPGNHDGVNNVFFSSTIYGQSFGDAVAVTTEWTVPGKSTVRSEADVILNSALNWNSYRGNFLYLGNGQPIYDLRRVLLHEFGHVVGLDHPDSYGQSVDAIMNSHVSDTDYVLADDIRGGQSIYGAQPGTEPVDPVNVLAAIERPKRNVTGTGGSYFFLGSADPSRVGAVYLANSRYGNTKLLKTRGLQQWNRSVPVKQGRNVVSLYVRDLDGMRRKIAQRVVTRKVSN